MNKYHATKIRTPEGEFHSKAEYSRWQELKLEEKAGTVTELRRQVRYELIPPMPGMRGAYYVADFVYRRGANEVVEDRKGYRDRLYLLKAKLMFWRHKIRILET